MWEEVVLNGETLQHILCHIPLSRVNNDKRKVTLKGDVPSGHSLTYLDAAFLASSPLKGGSLNLSEGHWLNK